MSIVISIVLVTLAIAAMMLIRLVIFHQALDARLKAGQGDPSCSEPQCFQGCSGGIDKSERSRTGNQSISKRSDSHAS